MAVPAMPGAGLVMIKAELVLSGLERILDRPAVSLDLDQGLDRCAGRAPAGEIGELAVGDAAADQEAPRPQAGTLVVVLSGLEIGQFQVGPIIERPTLGPLAVRKVPPQGGLKVACNLFRRAGYQRLVAPRVERVRAVDAQHVALAGPPQRHLDLAYAIDAVGRHPRE